MVASDPKTAMRWPTCERPDRFWLMPSRSLGNFKCVTVCCATTGGIVHLAITSAHAQSECICAQRPRRTIDQTHVRPETIWIVGRKRFRYRFGKAQQQQQQQMTIIILRVNLFGGILTCDQVYKQIPVRPYAHSEQPIWISANTISRLHEQQSLHCW